MAKVEIYGTSKQKCMKFQAIYYMYNLRVSSAQYTFKLKNLNEIKNDLDCFIQGSQSSVGFLEVNKSLHGSYFLNSILMHILCTYSENLNIPFIRLYKIIHFK
jgi:hypothetical protein